MRDCAILDIVAQASQVLMAKTLLQRSGELTAQKRQKSLRHSFGVCATRLTVTIDALLLASQVAPTCSGVKP